MNDEVRKRIIRAAVAWERVMHEKIADYEKRNADIEIRELAEAVKAYNLNLLLDDVGEEKDEGSQ